MNTIGVVVIGRNESPRLAGCLQSVRAGGPAGGAPVVDIVYVDSNSADSSVDIARAQNAHVVMLQPLAAPAPAFTAARARNAGAEVLLARHPNVSFIQFLDGDTVLHGGWLEQAARYLGENPDVAVVSGRLREKFPGGSVYNQLADMEWNTPAGVAAEFAGNAFIRASVFRDLHGYTPHFIAGEEPELAARMRLAGYRIFRLDHDMAVHDLHMTSFRQWWRRTRRSGYALAQLYVTHGGAPLHLYKKQHRSTLFWTTAVPALIIALGWLITWWAMLLLPLAYMYLMLRIARHRLARGDARAVARTYALFTALAKFPQLLGMLTYYANVVQKRTPRLIEYKAGVKPAAAPAAAAPHLTADN